MAPRSAGSDGPGPFFGAAGVRSGVVEAHFDGTVSDNLDVCSGGLFRTRSRILSGGVCGVLLCASLCVPLLFGCGGPRAGDPLAEERFQKAEQGFDALGRPQVVRVVKDEYFGLRRIPLDDEHAPILSSPVTLRVRAELSVLCDTLMRMVPLHVTLVQDSDAPGQSRESARGEDLETDPRVEEIVRREGMGSRTSTGPSGLAINYEGELRGLLDQIAAASGYGWDYSRRTNTVTFARLPVKTFVLATAPGKVRAGSTITNQSREGDQTGADSSRSSQIAQQYRGELEFDTFGDTVATVKTLLTREGTVVANEAAGTITVRDRPDTLRRVGAYIAEVNANFSRQVALKVNVYAVDISDTTKAGVELAALLPSFSVAGGHVALQMGALQSLAGSAQALVLDGQCRGSQAILEALRKVGRARQVTSAGIVTLNNQPAPVEAIQKISYLAGQTTHTRDYGTETSLTPGEVTTGFSMTVTPHIVKGGSVVLQYNVHLSSLDAMDSFASNHSTIQLPRISTRAFSQKARMRMGQTLVLAGFQHAKVSNAKKAGILSFGHEENRESQILVVTIELENADPRSDHSDHSGLTVQAGHGGGHGGAL